MPKSSFNYATIDITDLRGGRSHAVTPVELPEIQCVEAYNVEWYQTQLGRRRLGSAAIGLTGGTAFTPPFIWLFRHVPGADEAAAELWATDSASPNLVKRLTGGTAWADVALDDAFSASTVGSGVSFNGKLFLAYPTAVNQLHVWDSGLSKVRRAGIAQAAVPTTGALAAGAVTDTRTYKIAWTYQSGGVTLRRSELSAATAAVVMAGQQVPITKPATPGDVVTHWELYTASTNGLYYLIATTAIGTATVNDNNAAIPTTTPEPTVGINQIFTSGKFLATDGNRLYMAGNYNTAIQQSRVWFSPVLGDNNVGDDERTVNSVARKNYIDFNENDGGAITGISQAVQGSLYVFKYRQIYKLTPTGDLDTPFLSYKVSQTVGCIQHEAIAIGEDQGGDPALYFVDATGPYRLGSNGLEYLGKDIEDLWENLWINSNGIAKTFTARSLYYPRKHQWWVWVKSDVKSTMLLVFTTLNGVVTEQGIRGGWAVYDGGLVDTNVVATLFSQTLAASMSYSLRPYLGTASKILQADSSAEPANDDGTVFRAYIRTRAFSPGGLGVKIDAKPPLLCLLGAYTRFGVSALAQVQVKYHRDFGVETVSQSIIGGPTSPQTHMYFRYHDISLADCTSLQVEIGDPDPAGGTPAGFWVLAHLAIPYEIQAER